MHITELPNELLGVIFTTLAADRESWASTRQCSHLFEKIALERQVLLGIRINLEDQLPETMLERFFAAGHPEAFYRKALFELIVEENQEESGRLMAIAVEQDHDEAAYGSIFVSLFSAEPDIKEDALEKLKEMKNRSNESLYFGICRYLMRSRLNKVRRKMLEVFANRRFCNPFVNKCKRLGVYPFARKFVCKGCIADDEVAYMTD